jgi:hypothetical protein
MKTTTESLKASDLSIGQKVKYGLFTVTFMGIDERNHVLLKDSDGEVRNIFLELFETHAKIA